MALNLATGAAFSKRFPFLPYFLASAILFTTSVLWFGEIDRLPTSLVDSAPWDFGMYKSMAEQLLNSSAATWVGVSEPWNSRIALPGLWATSASFVGITAGAKFWGVIGSCLYFLTLAFFLRGYVLSRPLWLALIAIMIVAPSFPIRQTIAHPFSGLWLEAIVAIYLAWFWVALRRGASKWVYSVFLALAVLLSFAREVVLYGLLLLIALTIASRWLGGLVPNLATYFTLRGQALKTLAVAAMFAAATKFTISNLFPASDSNPLQQLQSVIVSIYRWANLVDLAAGFFIAFGPLVALFLFTAKKARVGRTEQFDLAAPALILGVFAFVGGTDLDRFLVWAAPVWAALIFSNRALDVVVSGTALRNTVFFFAAISLILSLRLFLPAIPSYALVQSDECGVVPVVDWSPDRLQGLSLGVPADLLSAAEDVSFQVVPKSALISQQALQSCGKNSFFALDGLGVNNIPVGFSFLNNQFDLLTLHPFHGDWKTKLPFVLQWMVPVGLALVLAKGPGSNRKDD